MKVVSNEMRLNGDKQRKLCEFGLFDFTFGFLNIENVRVAFG